MKKKYYYIALFASLVVLFLYQNFTPVNNSTLTETKSAFNDISFASCQNENLSSVIVTSKRTAQGDSVSGTVGDMNFEGQLPLTIGPCLAPATANEIKICRDATANDYLKFVVRGSFGEINTEFMTLYSCESSPTRYDYE